MIFGPHDKMKLFNYFLIKRYTAKKKETILNSTNAHCYHKSDRHPVICSRPDLPTGIVGHWPRTHWFLGAN